MKKVGIIFISILLIAAFIIWLADHKIDTAAKDRVYSDIKKIPHRKVGLLLGTSKYLANRQENPYFTYRINAAVALFNRKKIDFILVSGDNRHISYNEPRDMRNALIKRGIPADKIYLDYAGLRTLDSVIRANKIFGQQSFTVISQEFHNKRAIYIGKSKGLNLIGYNAKDVTGENSIKTNIREKFARVKVFLDILTNKKPKFLGEDIIIN